MSERSLNATADHRAHPAGGGGRQRHHAVYAAGAGSDDRCGGQPAQYRFVLENPNLTRSSTTWVPKLVARLQGRPATRQCQQRPAQQGLTVSLVIDRPTAGRFGITPATVDNALYDAFGQRIVSTVYTQSNQYRVILEADPSLQHTIDSLNTIYLPSSLSTTGQVPLSAIVHVQQQAGPLQISHLSQFPATTISFDVAPGASLGCGGGDSVTTGGAGHRSCRQLRHRVPGGGGGAAGVDRPTSCADPRRGGGDVYRAGRAL